MTRSNRQKVTVSLNPELYAQFQEIKADLGISLSAWIDSEIAKKIEEMNTRYYVLGTDEPFITMEKIFYTLKEATEEANKSDKYSGVVQGKLVYMK